LKISHLDPEALLFTRDGQRPLSPNIVEKGWRRLLRQAKVRYRSVKTLRSTCASHLLSRGAPLPDVAAQGGWRNASVLLVHYATAIRQGQEVQRQPDPVTPATPVRPEQSASA
jgi:integrase